MLFSTLLLISQQLTNAISAIYSLTQLPSTKVETNCSFSLYSETLIGFFFTRFCSVHHQKNCGRVPILLAHTLCALIEVMSSIITVYTPYIYIMYVMYIAHYYIYCACTLQIITQFLFFFPPCTLCIIRRYCLLFDPLSFVQMLPSCNRSCLKNAIYTRVPQTSQVTQQIHIYAN